MTGDRAEGVTIGQAAAFAGVTVKTVRHYHRLGLLAEPRRDGSGYRRYGSDDLLRLVQARTLATAGVPLSEIASLLDADPERFADALADVERRLTDRITDLIARRDALYRLADDRALLSDRALAVLDRMAGLGFGPDYVAGQREALVLFRALAPEGLDHFLTNLEHRLDDPGYVDLIKRSVAAESWEPEDPRIEELATAIAANLLADRELLAVPAGFRIGPDTATRYGMIDHHREDRSPAWARLNALVEAELRSAGVPIPHH
ncbi:MULTISPECIES: MerR family transcriptional regulator [Nocardiopsis]|uniref:MerR family transcriptional regulator n=1 Tax=Nocardiopsis changdeensis TaxID=2831969 RepID=A0ABX8BTB6_9ACTN|nr:MULTISPECIES: MerR family transcriptional regulator [Nocardiopsis]QUX25502.1 MerR family transcriptional regulator [Nocardiopsis changdeensis]QYX35888.1 MerR family transcriptional regulator [Nocardiopsis sp. MT53]